jgi:hypothetical protein
VTKLQFERGHRDAPVGHALLYFRADDAILATYITVPPITFDLANYMPPMMAGMMQGAELSEAIGGAPLVLPPMPEQVESLGFLQALAEQRQDDLVFGGVTTRSNPVFLMQETAEAASEYVELYRAVVGNATSVRNIAVAEPSRFADMVEQDRLIELSRLVGRLRDSLGGPMDLDIERQLQELAELLPAKYRVQDVVTAARTAGGRGQRLAELHIERCFKLYHEEYLDLERIDREIAAIQG